MRPGTENRYLGSLMGLAVGDALAGAIDSKTPPDNSPVGNMRGSGLWNLKPGQWTDKTSMALCLAASIVERHGFDTKDQMNRYLRWRDEGYMSSTGQCLGMGETVAKSLHLYETTGNLYTDPLTECAADDGSLMRLAPVPMYMVHDARRAKELAAAMSKTTHEAIEAVDCCRYMAGMMVGALRGEAKDLLLSDLYSPVYNYWLLQHFALTSRVDSLARGVYKSKKAEDLSASGCVVDTMEAALWAFHQTDSFREGVLLAINLGDGTGAAGAVYGQLAGACYGATEIPSEWTEVIADRELIEDLARKLMYETAQSIRHFADL